MIAMLHRSPRCSYDCAAYMYVTLIHHVLQSIGLGVVISSSCYPPDMSRDVSGGEHEELITTPGTCSDGRPLHHVLHRTATDMSKVCRAYSSCARACCAVRAVRAVRAQEGSCAAHLPVMYPPTNWNTMKEPDTTKAMIIFVSTCTSTLPCVICSHRVEQYNVAPLWVLPLLLPIRV